MTQTMRLARENGDNADAALVEGFVAGDAEAMKSLYAKYRVEVYSWLVHTLRDAAEAEDLYQEAWLKAISGASGFAGGSFRAWLWRIVRNLAVDNVRKKRPELSVDDGSGCWADVADANAAPPGCGMEERERRKAARAAIAALPAHEREVVLLRTAGSLEFKEISRLLGIPLNTALARMHRAVARLKAALETFA